MELSPFKSGRKGFASIREGFGFVAQDGDEDRVHVGSSIGSVAVAARLRECRGGWLGVREEDCGFSPLGGLLQVVLPVRLSLFSLLVLYAVFAVFSFLRPVRLTSRLRSVLKSFRSSSFCDPVFNVVFLMF